MSSRFFCGVLLAVALVVPGAGAATKEARPLGALLQEGARIVAAADRLVWLETGAGVYLCVIELSPRFEAALKYRKVRDLYRNWPRALCFNAASFE